MYELILIFDMLNLYYIAQKFKLLYRIPPEYWLLIMTGFLAFWTLLMGFLCRSVPVEQSRNTALLQSSVSRNKLVFALNLALMLVGLTIILLVTFVRRESSVHKVILIPLRVLFGQKAPGDYWQVTIMNIVLYVPFACGLCFAMGKKRPHPVRGTVLICFISAFVAEALQYILGSGTAEMDDVLVNILGASLGTIPYILCQRIKRIKGA